MKHCDCPGISVRRIGSKTAKALVFLGVLAILTAGLFSCQSQKTVRPDLGIGYQAVLLANNSVYFGKIDEMGSDLIVLSDVFYVRSKPTADPKVVTNVITKRGSEIHKPDKMYINRAQMVMIEPVAADSQLAELIRQEKAKVEAGKTK
jgi:hypothetical protein